ncbi:MAG TPA: hypothetical protein VG226_12210 [Acidimicrobiales bacterium]|nr:hypothetical protein [Acidimicrobiales bacterium]
MDLGPLGLDRGGHLLVDRALAGMAPGQRLRVRGADPHLGLHLPVWARSRGHAIVDGSVVVAGDAVAPGLASAERAGSPAMVADVASPSWGLAARGALVEAGGPALEVADLHTRDVWSDLAPKLYAQAAAGQWDPATAVDWSPPDLPDEVEAAVVQVMTYLVENEQAALMVPARFLGRMNPHFREAIGFLATQIADEARHVAVFSRRATLTGRPLGISGTGGRASLQTLLDEPEWANASFLLSVLGEGTFLSLLAFLDRHGPDPVTAGIAHLVLQDEARHVAFALGHLGEHVTRDPGCRHRLRAAIERRHDALAQTAGLAPAVHDSLVLLAAGSWEPGAIAVGWDRVQALRSEMGEGRTRRLVRLGFTEVEASQLAALHAESFM